jgi:hypothetical protein
MSSKEEDYLYNLYKDGVPTQEDHERWDREIDEVRNDPRYVCYMAYLPQGFDQICGITTPPPPFEVMVRTTKAQYQKNLKQGKVSKTVEQMEQVMSDNKSLLYIHLVPMILGGVKVYVTILPRKD